MVTNKRGRPKKTPEQKLFDKIRSGDLTAEEVETAVRVLRKGKREAGCISLTHNFRGRKHYKIGIIGDTHAGNRWADWNYVKSVMKFFKDEKADFVIHTGDMTDGPWQRHKNVLEQYAHGFDRQVEDFIKRFPDIGVPIYIIDGNHDGWYRKGDGGIVGKTIAQRRDDVEYLGQDEANIRLGRLEMMMSHPDDGTAYAYCFDDKTEILTDNGWKLFKDVNKNRDWVATLNPNTFIFEWQKPKKHIEQDFNGELLHFNARCFDLMVTPNHRMWVRRYNRNKKDKKIQYPNKARKQCDYSWGWVEAKDLVGRTRQSWQMIRNSHGFKHPRLSISEDDLIKLYAWYITEGCCHKNGKQITITQCPNANPENWDEIKSILKRLKIKFGIYGKRQKDFTISNKRLTTEFKGRFGRTSYEKKIPYFLKNLPLPQLKLFLSTLIKGDGWNTKNGWGYKSFSKQLVDDVQEIAIKCGYGASSNKDTVNITRIQNYPTINTEPTHKKYKGNVYCVTVPNSIILVRRSGKAIWSGNSYKPQRQIESMMKMGERLPDFIFQGHYHKMFYMNFGGVHYYCTGTTCRQTPWMRGKKIAADLGAWMVDIYLNNRGELARVVNTELPYKGDTHKPTMK